MAFVFFSPALLMCPLPLSPLRHRPCPEAESKAIDVVHLLLSGGHLKFVQLLRQNMKVKVRGDRSHLLHCSLHSIAWMYIHCLLCNRIKMDSCKTTLLYCMAIIVVL